MNINEITGYVVKADTNTIELIATDPKIKNSLASLGFLTNEVPDKFTIQTNSNDEKAKVFDSLRNLGIAFSYGREWCPSEVFEYFRDIGLLSGDFQRIQWRGPDDFYITKI